MRICVRYLTAILLCFACTCAVAEQIELKGGTKFTGTVVAVQGDIFRVKTAYGEIQVPGEHSFSDANSGDKVPEKDSAPVEETLSGTNYINRTGGVELTVPEDGFSGPSCVKSSPI